MTTNLAYRMRPQIIDDVVGQKHLLAENQLLNLMVKSKKLSSLILYGPPGTGKTSIASALSGSTGLPFHYFNASTDDKKKLQAIIKKIDDDKPIILLLDEIHRLDKPKQDFLLPYTESGQIILIGATTENPYISIQPAIRSRSQILELEPVSPDDIVQALKSALTDKKRGYGNKDIHIKPETLQFIANNVNGDVRKALNALELAVESTTNEKDNKIIIQQQTIETCLQRKPIDGDATGDAHYNVISALQKSIRGSDPDAALHYLARLLETGDLITAVRRLNVIVFEDIGLANYDLWQAITAATNTALTLGLPEARIPLADAVVLMALSPKSNWAYTAYDKAVLDLQQTANLDIPRHLRDGHYKGAKELGNSINYKYAHDYPYHIVNQQYLPSSLQKASYLTIPEPDTSNIQDWYKRYQVLKTYTSKEER